MEHEKKNGYKLLKVSHDMNESLQEVAGMNDVSTTMEYRCLKCSLKGALMQTFPDRYQGALIFHQ